MLAGSRIIYFGGRGEDKKVYKDIYALDPNTMEWFEGPEGSGSPSARFGHSASLVGGVKMVVFGGWNGDTFFNDVHILHLEKMSWAKPDISGPPPSPRYMHAAVTIKSAILIHSGFCFHEDYFFEKVKFGSKLRECYLSDMRLLDTEKMMWIRFNVSGVPPKSRMGHTFNISGSCLLMFGGWTLDSASSKADEDDNEQFKILNTEKFCWETCAFKRKMPEPRYGHSATSVGSHLLIFGGWEHNRSTNDVLILRNVETV